MIASATFLSGLGGFVPMPYLIAAASVAFAGTATGLLAVSNWRERARIEGRLTFSTVLFDPHISRNDEHITLEGARLGVQVNNMSIHDLTFQVDEMHTELFGRVNSSREHQPKPIQIPAGGVGFWRDAYIPVGEAAPASDAGRIRFKISYWRSPVRKYNLQKDFFLSVHVADEAKAGLYWTEA